MKATDNIRISRNGLKRPSTRTAPRVLTRQGEQFHDSVYTLSCYMDNLDDIMSAIKEM